MEIFLTLFKVKSSRIAGNASDAKPGIAEKIDETEILHKNVVDEHKDLHK